MNKISKIGLWGAASALVLALGACSSPAVMDEAAAEVMEGFAVSAADTQMMFLSNPAGMVALGTMSADASVQSAFLSPLGLSPQQTCTATFTGSVDEFGDPVDSDGDGVYANAEASYNCQDGNYSSSGSVEMTDADDNDAASGFSITINDLESSSTFEGQTVTVGMDGSYVLTVNGGTYSADMDLRISASGGGESASLTYDFEQDYVAAVDGNSDPFDAGTLDFSGTFAVNFGGEFYSLTATGENLVWNGFDFDSGTVTLADSAGNELVVTFTGSGSWTATYNGGAL